MSNLSELAESVATEFRTGESLPAPPTDDPGVEVAVDEDEPLDADQRYLFANRIRFAWKTDDQDLLDRIRKAADQVFQDLFAEAIGIIDEFYRGMRVQVGVTPEGRPQWQLDETGRPIERLDALTGQDMDQAILNLERILLTITPQVNQLRLEALFAQNTAKDAFDDAFPTSGIADSRSAQANKASRPDRWQSYFRYYIYSTANAFFQECRQFTKRLDSIRYRQIQSG